MSKDIYDFVICYSDIEGEHAITETEAIERQREVGRRHDYEYASDEAALADFIALHWARRTE
jgi:hypothetical protein